MKYYDKESYFERYRALNKKGDAYVVMAASDLDFPSKVPAVDVLDLDQELIDLKYDFKDRYGVELRDAAAEYEGQEILFSHGDRMLSVKDGQLVDTKDGKQEVMGEATEENRRQAHKKVFDEVVQQEKIRILQEKEALANMLAEEKGLYGGQSDASPNLNIND